MRGRKNKGVIAALLLLWLTGIHAEQLCNQIKNEDDQNYCRSIESGDKKYCKKIMKNDTKNLCLAKAENNASFCKQIENPKIHKRCLDSVH